MKLIESLEREGGHILTLLILVLICLALSYTGLTNPLVEKCGDLALGALLLSMKGSGNKREDEKAAAETAEIKLTPGTPASGPASLSPETKNQP